MISDQKEVIDFQADQIMHMRQEINKLVREKEAIQRSAARAAHEIEIKYKRQIEHIQTENKVLEMQLANKEKEICCFRDAYEGRQVEMAEVEAAKPLNRTAHRPLPISPSMPTATHRRAGAGQCRTRTTQQKNVRAKVAHLNVESIRARKHIGAERPSISGKVELSNSRMPYSVIPVSTNSIQYFLSQKVSNKNAFAGRQGTNR